MFLHALFGLRIASNLQIPLLPAIEPHSGPVDVQVTLQECPEWAKEALGTHSELFHASRERDGGIADIRLWKLDGGKFFRLAFADGAEFCFDRAGSRIFGTHARKFDVEDVTIPLRGVAMGLVLHLRGLTCLHAAAFALNGRAVALCGPSTCGKSTTVAALGKRGYAVLTEDVLPVSEGEQIYAQPAFPALTLWPDAAELLLGASHGLAALCSVYPKLYLRLDQPGWRFQSSPLPLGAVYVLDESVPAAQPFVSELAPQQRLALLAANIYHVQLLAPDVYSRELLQLGRVANSVPVKRLNLGSSRPRLDLLCDCIVADAAKILPATFDRETTTSAGARSESQGG